MAVSEPGNLSESVDLYAGIYAARAFAWFVIATTFAFLTVNYLTFWHSWPGAHPLLGELGLFGFEAPKTPLEGEAKFQATIQLLIYILSIVAPLAWPKYGPARTLRQDSAAIMSIASYMIRVCFWAVVLIGAVDAVISFLRVEDLLNAVVGEELSKQLARPRFRGPYVQMPLLAISMVIGAFNRSLGFHWLALLVVGAELFIVLSRFVFSYEQAFQGDLVRFWYAGLFLFASAFTLYEDGHVRVDVLYTNFSNRTKGLINAIGCVVLGMALCWVILAVGMASKSSILASPLVNYEVSQSGFGMYVKYLMAGFLAIFAISMMVQFTSYFLESVADYRDDPGGRQPSGDVVH